MIDIKTKKIRIWDCVLLFICFFMTFKQLNVLFPPLSTVGFLMVGSLVLFFLANPRLNATSSVWLALYSLVLVLNYLSGDKYFDSIGDVVQEIVILFFTSSLTFYIISNEHIKLAKILIFSTLAVIIYYSISSFIIEQENPGIIRNTVYMTNVGDLEELRFVYSRGLATYQLPHAVPILIPPLVMCIRGNTIRKWQRILYVVALIAIFVITFISYAATALFLAISILILTLLFRAGKAQNNIVRLVVIGIILLPLIINPGIIVKPFLGLLSSAEDASYVEKLMDIEQLTGSGVSSGSVAARESKYEITLYEIMENPLLGTNNRTGEHSAIFDRWACLGLIGWIPYLMFLFSQYKLALKRICKDKRAYYVLGILAASFMLFTKNMSNWETWFMVFTILPLMIWLQSQPTMKR